MLYTMALYAAILAFTVVAFWDSLVLPVLPIFNL